MSAGGGAPPGAPMVIGENSRNGPHAENRDYVGSGQNGGNLGGRIYEKFYYNQCDSGPYKVVVEKIEEEKKSVSKQEEKQIGINKITVGIVLKQNGLTKTVLDVKKIGRTKVLVFFSEWKDANRLVNCQNLPLKRFRAFIPKSFVTVKGVIAGIPEDLKPEELLEDIDTDKQILEVFRLQRMTAAGVKVPTEKVGIVLRSNKLPSFIRVYSVVTKVEPYVTKAVMCNSCLRYGHIAKNCKGRKRCKNCGENHDEDDDECQNQTKCVHCKDTHKSSDSRCPERNKQNNIKKLMASKNLTFQEARDEFRISTRNSFSILDQADGFPSVYESFANTVKKRINQERTAQRTTPTTRNYNQKQTEQQQNRKPEGSKKTIEQKGKEVRKPEGSNRIIDDEGFETVTYVNKKRKTQLDNNTLEAEKEVITLERHLELRKRWDDKMKQIAEQKEALQTTVGQSFNKLSQALANKDEKGYYILLEVLQELASPLGYDVQQVLTQNNIEHGHIQDITK